MFPLGDFCAGVADVECGIHVGIAEGVVPVKGEFPAAGAEFACILVWGGGTEDCGQFGARAEHVFGLALIPVEAYVDGVVEEAEVEADVGGYDAFPCERGGYQSRHVVHNQFLVAVQPVDFRVRHGGNSGEELVVAHGLVADVAVGCTEFTVAPPFFQRSEVAFLGEAVAERAGGEECPLVGSGEAAGTVVATVELYQVDALVVVVDTAEETCGGTVGVLAAGGVVSAVGEVDVRQVVVDQTVAFCVEITVFFFFSCPAEHNLEVVGIGECVGVRSEHIGGPHGVAVVALGCIGSGLAVGLVVAESAGAGSPCLIQAVGNGCGVAVLVAEAVGEVGLQGETFDDLCLQPALESGLVHPFLIHMRAVAYAHLIAE